MYNHKEYIKNNHTCHNYTYQAIYMYIFQFC